MEKFKKITFVDFTLIIFLIIQPIFDLKFFYNSISTLIRVIIILGLFCYYFVKSNNKKKYLLLLYPLILLIYFLFHHWNALNFTSLIPGNFNYSILKEALYFLKMICPFLLIYSLFKSKINGKTYIKIIKYIVLIISSIIIFSNIFMFSYGNYSNTKIKANFFQWFNTDYSYLELASKGLFEYGNQISAILIMFLPFSILSVLKTDNIKQKILNIIVLIANIFSLILLCTRVSVLGITVVFAYTLFAILFIKFMEKYKQKNRNNYCVIPNGEFDEKISSYCYYISSLYFTFTY